MSPIVAAKAAACNSLSVDRRFLAITRLSCTVGTLGYLNLIRDRRFVRLVEHNTSRRTPPEATRSVRIELDVGQGIDQRIKRAAAHPSAAEQAELGRCRFGKRHGRRNIGHPSSACWLSHGSNRSTAASRAERSDNCSTSLSQAIACANLAIFHAGSMSGIQLQIANDAISGQPDDTSDDIVGVGVGRFDQGAARAWRPAHRTISGGYHTLDSRRQKPLRTGSPNRAADSRPATSSGRWIISRIASSSGVRRFELGGSSGSTPGSYSSQLGSGSAYRVLIAGALLRCWTRPPFGGKQLPQAKLDTGAVGDLDDVLIKYQRVGMLADDIERPQQFAPYLQGGHVTGIQHSVETELEERHGLIDCSMKTFGSDERDRRDQRRGQGGDPNLEFVLLLPRVDPLGCSRPAASASNDNTRRLAENRLSSRTCSSVSAAARGDPQDPGGGVADHIGIALADDRLTRLDDAVPMRVQAVEHLALVVHLSPGGGVLVLGALVTGRMRPPNPTGSPRSSWIGNINGASESVRWRRPC